MALRIDPEALEGVPHNLRQRATDKLRWLWDNRADIRHEQLRHQLNPYYKLRTGSLRIIYTWDQDDDDLRVLLVGLRDDVYERASGL